jgi:hypothetical protein
MKPSIKHIVWTMLIATVAINVVAVAAMRMMSSNAPLGLAAGLTAMIAFVGMLMLSREPDGSWRLSESAMRTAIASAFIAEYVALVSMVAFSKESGDLPAVGQTLVTNFTQLVGVVIAFYFGASAYVEGRRLTAGRGVDPRQTQPSDPGESMVMSTPGYSGRR